MELKVTRQTFQIIPDTPQDAAFIEEVLGLRRKDDTALCRRVAVSGIDSALAYVEVGKASPPVCKTGEGSSPPLLNREGGGIANA